MKVLVTGASGFIGRAVVARCLDDGMTVTAVTRDSSRVTPADRLRVVELAADDPAGWPEALAGHESRTPSVRRAAIEAPPSRS